MRVRGGRLTCSSDNAGQRARTGGQPEQEAVGGGVHARAVRQDGRQVQRVLQHVGQVLRARAHSNPLRAPVCGSACATLGSGSVHLLTGKSRVGTAGIDSGACAASSHLELRQQPCAGVGYDDAHLGKAVKVAICARQPRTQRHSCMHAHQQIGMCWQQHMPRILLLGPYC